jgi:hypothetical protein
LEDAEDLWRPILCKGRAETSAGRRVGPCPFRDCFLFWHLPSGWKCSGAGVAGAALRRGCLGMEATGVCGVGSCRVAALLDSLADPETNNLKIGMLIHSTDSEFNKN